MARIQADVGDRLDITAAQVDLRPARGMRSHSEFLEREDGSIAKTRVPIIETDFAFRLKAKEGDEIPLHKIRELLLDLRANGFNIKKFSSDLRLASADTLQILKKAGFNVEYLSVDKTDKPYLDLRNLIYEKRWVCHNIPLLTFEEE